MKTFLCLMLVCLSGQGYGDTAVDAFRALTDNRVAVRTALGVRYARPLSPDQVELAMGMSVTRVVENPLAFRVISETDPDYAYDKYVKPVKAECKKVLECEGPEGSPFLKFEKVTVTLQLPVPMKEGMQYTVVAQGAGGDIATGAHTAGSFLYQANVISTVSSNTVDLAVLGLRQLMPVGNGVIKLEFGPDFSAQAASKPANYKVTLNDRPVQVVNLGRISRIDTYLPVGWPFVAIPMHEVFLRLSEPFRDGDVISVEVAPSLTTAANSARLVFRNSRTFSDAIKVNQIGYLADSPVKIAYLGRWMGSFPELKAGAAGSDDGRRAEQEFWSNLKDLKSQAEEFAAGQKDEKAGKPLAPATTGPVMGPALAFDAEPAFALIAEGGTGVVFSGKSKLIHISGTLNEGVLGYDHSGENVYVMDFTGFKTPGRYVITVPGVGCSLPFAIGEDVFVKAFQVQAYGVFAQRCGIELKPPFSNWHRIACHNKGLTLTSQMKTEPHDIGALPTKVLCEKIGAKPDAATATLAADPALAARYEFEGNFSDSSGHGVDLAPASGKPHFASSDPRMFTAGQCFGPTGDGEKNGALGTINLNISQGATFSFWFKKNNANKFGGFFNLGAAPDSRISLMGGWGVPILQIGKGNGRMPTLKMDRLGDNTWRHVTATLDPAGKNPRLMSLYLNGVQVGCEAVAALDEVISGSLQIGCLEGEEAGGAFLDDFRIYRRLLSSDEIKTLATPQPAERPVVIQAYGGHHDAGDYNPRAHYEVAQKLMNVYEMAPRKFYDGQLNIPEKGNGLPDILDEAYWALRLWIDLQDKDGGVRNGTESDGDPNFIQTVELDPRKDFAYAKDAEGSFLFAGMMAQASRLWLANGKTAEAAQFLEKARKAYDWAVANPLKVKDSAFFGFRVAPVRAYAAAQLLHTTREPRFNKDFLDFCVWSQKPDADLEVHKHYDMQDAAWAYVMCPDSLVDVKIQAAIKAAVIRKADGFMQQCSTMAYAFIRHPWAPINWGTGAYQNFLTQVAQAYTLTGDRKYLYWMVRTFDNTLGANPLCRSYIVGAGERTVRAPLHNSRYSSSGEVVEGMQVQGPVQSGEGYRIKETAYPKIRDEFACLYTFVDNHFAISMNEGVVTTEAQTLAMLGLMLPDHK